mgnify:CR=1 FL=1
MTTIVRQILLSRPVLIGGAVLVGAREFLALQRTQAATITRTALRSH